MSRRTQAVALLLAALTAAPLSAQDGLRPASFDAGVGFGVGRGGGRRDARDGVAASALLAWRLHGISRDHLLIGLGVAAQSVIDGGDDCLLASGGACVPNYPWFRALGVMGGWEARHGAEGSAVRALAGPAVFRSEERATALGLQGRVDVATPPVVHVALTAWGQGALVPRLRSERYSMASFGLGLRVR